MLVSAPEARSAEGDEGGAAALGSSGAAILQDKPPPYFHLCFQDKIGAFSGDYRGDFGGMFDRCPHEKRGEL